MLCLPARKRRGQTAAPVSTARLAMGGEQQTARRR
jgi:hypothetical protein